MQNNAMFTEVMAGKPPRRDGETAPDWHAPQMPRIFPKIMLGGLVLVILSAFLSGPIDRSLKARRIVAQTEAANESKLQKRMSEFESRAHATARSLETDRNRLIVELAAFRDSAKTNPDATERESYRRALEDIHEPAEASKSTTLDLGDAIKKDRDIYAKGGSSPAVDAATAEYRAATKAMSEYISALKDARSRNYRKLILEASTQKGNATLEAAESARGKTLDTWPKLPESIRQAAAPRPRPTPSHEPAKRQITNW